MIENPIKGTRGRSGYSIFKVKRNLDNSNDCHILYHSQQDQFSRFS